MLSSLVHQRCSHEVLPESLNPIVADTCERNLLISFCCYNLPLSHLFAFDSYLRVATLKVAEMPLRLVYYTVVGMCTLSQYVRVFSRFIGTELTVPRHNTPNQFRLYA